MNYINYISPIVAALVALMVQNYILKRRINKSRAILFEKTHRIVQELGNGKLTADEADKITRYLIKGIVK